jgi:ferredoxin
VHPPASVATTRARPAVMRVQVDYDVCASTGSCMQICPEVFEVRSDGYLYLLQEEPGEELRQRVQEAAEMCPTGAISIEG